MTDSSPCVTNFVVGAQGDDVNLLLVKCAENLWDHLRRVGLNENDVKHPSFGNIKQAIEALVQQR